MLQCRRLDDVTFEQLHRSFSSSTDVADKPYFYGHPGRSPFGVYWRGEPFAVFCVNTSDTLLALMVSGEQAEAVQTAIGSTSDCVELCALAIAPAFRRTRVAMSVYAFILFLAHRSGRRRFVCWTKHARIADTYATGVEPLFVGSLAGHEGFWLFVFDHRVALPAWLRAMWRRRLGVRAARRRTWSVGSGSRQQHSS